MSVEDTFGRIKAEADARDMRTAAAQLRKYLAGALCAYCGEPLGAEGEIVQDDADRTLHAACLPGQQRYDAAVKT